MKMKKTKLIILAAFMLSACTSLEKPADVTSDTAAVQSAVPTETTTQTSPEQTTTPPPETEPPLPEYFSAELVFAGDNLIHPPIYNQANRRAGGEGYDFDMAYEGAADIIASADLAVLNQETIISDEFPPSNYPRFCTPSAMGDAMIELGFDAVSISNNHVLDQGEAGLLSTLAYWRENHPDIPVYGAYENAEDMNNIRLLEVNGITFAFLGYMEHTNGLYLPEDSQCELTYVSEEEEIERQIKKAAEISDCVIVSVHFGVEITNTVSQLQYSMSQKMADWGADVIVGTQPHTIQTMEYLDTADGRTAFVFYCLGNFISAQDVARSMVGMLGKITVTKETSTNRITVENAGAEPIINHYDYGYRDIRIIRWSEYTRELGAAHGCSGTSYDFFEQLIKENIPEEYLVSE